MAALYLHNAIFAPDTPSAHSHFRTSSSATLNTDQTHTTEPLLLHTDDAASGSATYHDHLSRRPESTEDSYAASGAGWDTGMPVDDRSTTQRERHGFWERSTRRRIRRLRAVLIVLEFTIGIWLVYCSVRYFLVFTEFNSRTGQVVALALGTSSAVSTALLGCAVALSAFQHALLVRNVPIRIITLVRLTLLSLSALFLVAPAIVSFVFVFVWRNSGDGELRFTSKCHLDVDVVWADMRRPSASSPCRPYSWAVWLGMSILRLGLTIGIVSLLLAVTVVYSTTRFPSLSSRHRRRPMQSRTHQYHYQRSSQSLGNFNPQQLYEQSLVQGHDSKPTGSPPHKSPQRPPKHQPSSSSLSGNSAPRHTLRSEPSRGTSTSSTLGNTGSTPTAVSGSPGGVGVDGAESAEPAKAERQQQREQELSDQENRELHSFVDRFRTLVAQISRETDEAVDFARRELQPPYPQPPHSPSQSYASTSSSELEEEQMDAQSLRETYFRQQLQRQQQLESQHQFQFPSMYPTQPGGFPTYPPDEHVPILNGFVRRMPTIESLGSYVGMSSVADSRAASRAGTGSRPATALGAMDGRPPSRGNSLNLVEMGYRAQNLQVQDVDASTTTGSSGSKSDTNHTIYSYNTASSGSALPSPVTGEFSTPMSTMPPLPEHDGRESPRTV